MWKPFWRSVNSLENCQSNIVHRYITNAIGFQGGYYWREAYIGDANCGVVLICLMGALA
jgi:hypothetical protein